MSMIRPLKIIYLLTLFFIIIPAISLAGHYQVIRVVDGDTIVIKYGGKYVDLKFEIKRLRGNYGRLLAYVFVDGQNLPGFG